MKLSSNNIFLLYVGIVCGITALKDSSRRSRRTWGPRLCMHLCTAGCPASPGYILEHRCHRTNVMSAQAQVDKRGYTFNTTKEVVATNVEDNRTCSKTFTVVHSNGSVSKCTKAKKGKSTVKSTEDGTNGQKVRQEKKLLLLPHASTNSSIKPVIMSFSDNSLTQVLNKNFDTRHIIAGAYTTRGSKLIIGRYSNKLVKISAYTGTWVPWNFQKKMSVNEIRVVERKKLCFCWAFIKKETIVFRMTLMGTGMEIIKTARTILGLVVNEKLSSIYTGSVTGIEVMDYNGEQRQHLTKGLGIPLGFDSSKDILYFNRGINLLKTFTGKSTKKVNKVKSFAAIPWKLLVYNDKLYITLDSIFSTIYILDSGLNTEVVKISMSVAVNLHMFVIPCNDLVKTPWLC